MNKIDEFFKNNLDNTMARISSGVLRVEGTMEESCKLEHVPFFGLRIMVKLVNNDSKLIKDVYQVLIQNRENFNITYDTRDEILKSLNDMLKESWVCAGMISCYGVKSISNQYDDKGIITSTTIEHTNGSILELRAIKKIENEIK